VLSGKYNTSVNESLLNGLKTPMVQECYVYTFAEYSRLHEFSCRLYLRFRTAYRFEIRFKTTVVAVNVPATVLWDGDRIFSVYTALRDTTGVVLLYQVALRLKAAGEVGGVACSPQCRQCCSHLHFKARHGCVCNPLHTRHTALTWPLWTSTCLAI
jgi:hypothetical protein